MASLGSKKLEYVQITEGLQMCVVGNQQNVVHALVTFMYFACSQSHTTVRLRASEKIILGQQKGTHSHTLLERGVKNT